jgi:membrane protein YdbS with pleckstrin-like domain
MNYFCNMLDKEQADFLILWEAKREEYSTTSSKLLRGLPMACIFALPILFLIAIVYFFIPDWYYKISKTSSQTFVVVAIAVFIVIIFYAFVRMHFKWEMNEQLFKELKQKQKNTGAAI